jgi:predicted ribosome quality control (RQC) complex YloA/Tae2 family protein
MHVRDAPSAHVLIKNKKGQAPPIPVLEEAARWLANVSRKGKSGETLEIIYTPAKWVRAVKGAPGRVTLGRFETLLITT